MKKEIRLLALVYFCAFSVVAQKKDSYFGNSNFVEVTSVSYFPLVQNYLNRSAKHYKKSGSSLRSTSPDWFNTGFRGAIGHAFKRNFAMSMECGMDFWSTPLEEMYGGTEVGQSGTYFQISRHENLKMTTVHFMPKLHFASSSALLPLGLNHEFGIGYTRTKVSEREYLSVLLSTSYVPESSAEYIDFERVYPTVQFLYALRMRKPLTQNLLLNYGLRYTLDVGLSSESSNSKTEKLYSATNGRIEDQVRNNLRNNILSFDLGITYAF